MISKYFFLFSLVMVFNVKSETKMCMTPDQFNSNRSVLFSSDVLKGIGNDIFPHQYIFNKAKFLGRGGYGEVRVVKDKVYKTAIKLLNLSKHLDASIVVREIEMLRRICKHNKDDSSKFAECNSRVIAPFYGCVEDGTSFYLFMRITNQDFSNEIVQIKYQRMEPFERVKAMLHIIDKFIQIHGFDIIHGDIKPSSIMFEDESIAQFRIFEFGSANYKGKDYFGGTHGYLAPERYGNDKYKTGLQPTDDVFALAMTFAELEGDFEFGHGEIKNKCFVTRKIDAYCEERIVQGLNNVFAEKKGLRTVREVFDHALNLNPLKRIQTMKDFSIALVDKLRNLKGASEYFSSILSSGDNFDERSSLPSFWKHRIVTMSETWRKARNVKSTPQEESGFEWGKFFRSIGRAFGCAENRKENNTATTVYKTIL